MGFIRSNKDLLGADPDKLVPLRAVQAGGRWYAAFQQIHNKVPVLGGAVHMSFTKDDRLISFGSDIYPDVDVNTTPALSGQAASKLALTDCSSPKHAADRITEPDLFIVPVPRGTKLDYRLCWRLDIVQSSVQKKWRYFIDAASGTVLSKRNILWYADVPGIAGTVTGWYKPEFASDPTSIAPFPHESITAEGLELPLYSWDFSTDPGWLTEGAWAFGKPSGGGSYCGDPASGATGANVYGYNLSGDYTNNMSVRYLTTTPINCSGYTNLRLKFKRWLGIEGHGWDNAFIEVSTNNADWIRVWEYSGAEMCDANWVTAHYDLPLIADNQPTVFIRWGIGPTDHSVTYPGWNIDDVEIVSVLGGINNTISLPDGTFQLPLPWEPSVLLSELSGPYVNVNYYGGPDAELAEAQIYPGPLSWVWDDSLCSVIDESHMYYHVNRIHDYYKTLDPAFSGLDYPVPAWVYVNFSNAYWDGYSMVFGRGDGIDFDNFALYAEVIYHEYTHGVTDKIYAGFELPYIGESGAINEGWSDYFGCLLTPSRNHFMGDGGLVIEEPEGLRTIVNSYRRETDWVNEVHFDSQVFSASLWQARDTIDPAIMDELVHFTRYAHTTTFEDYLTALLLEDDTRYGDNDLSNGTPHGEAIFRGFGDHGMGGLQYLAPSIVITGDTINHDGHLDPGETASLSLTLTNGWADASHIRGTLSTSDPYVGFVKYKAKFPSVLYGETITNAHDPFVIFVSPACPETHTIRLTLTITAHGPYSYSRECLLYYNVATRQLAYDDGEPEMSVGYGAAGGALAVKVTPDDYPCHPTHVRLFSIDNTAITVTIWGENNEGAPGDVLASLVARPPASPGWFDVDVSQFGLVINSGSVFVGWVEGQGQYGNGFDFDPPYYDRSWIIYDSDSWQLEEFGVLGNFMIRLRYSNEPPLRIQPPYQYSWCPTSPVSTCLVVADGTPPYHGWTALPLPEDYEYQVLPGSSFSVTGQPQGLHGDDIAIEYTLPFDFSYYGINYSAVSIGSNGLLDFTLDATAFYNNHLHLMDNIRIAPLWDDLTTYEPDDVFIDEAIPHQVAIRWQASTYADGQPAAFAVVLFDDGRIRFDYGPGNSGLTPTVGISAGDSRRYLSVSGYDDAPSLQNAPSVMFTPVPQRPALPPGVTLDEDTGCLTGIPANPGVYPVTVAVTDSSSPPQTAVRELTFNIGFPRADFNSSCSVNFLDYALMMSRWSDADCSEGNAWCNHADLDHDTDVDFGDLGIFAEGWLLSY